MLTGFYTVNVNVQQLDRSITFYEQLGFEVVLRFTVTDTAMKAMFESPDLRAVHFAWLRLATATRKGPLLDLVEFDPQIPHFEGNPRTRSGLCRLTFHVDDMERQEQQLAAAGVDFLVPLTRRFGPDGKPLELMWITDPDGTVIEFLKVAESATHTER
jgi:catechol 2,3-dioxygenase-like lactoylglutathione lyase family enzyme